MSFFYALDFWTFWSFIFAFHCLSLAFSLYFLMALAFNLLLSQPSSSFTVPVEPKGDNRAIAFFLRLITLTPLKYHPTQWTHEIAFSLERFWNRYSFPLFCLLSSSILLRKNLTRSTISEERLNGLCLGFCKKIFRHFRKTL